MSLRRLYFYQILAQDYRYLSPNHSLLLRFLVLYASSWFIDVYNIMCCFIAKLGTIESFIVLGKPSIRIGTVSQRAI